MLDLQIKARVAFCKAVLDIRKYSSGKSRCPNPRRYEKEFFEHISNMKRLDVELILNQLGSELVGCGSYRLVYTDPFNKFKVVEFHNVVKFEYIDCGLPTRSNLKEFMLYNETKYDIKIHERLAPVVHLTKNAIVLLMRRCKLFDYGEDRVGLDKMPAAIGDLGYRNLGSYNGRTVVLDYGIYNISSFALKGFASREETFIRA